MKYRKKPVVIEAEQFTFEMKDRVLDWVRSKNPNAYGDRDEDNNPIVKIPTLEGEMTASLGDYVIVGVQGEVYPCKPDIFEQTYELVDESVN